MADSGLNALLGIKERPTLPNNLRTSLNNQKSMDIKLKRKFDRLTIKQKKFDTGRPTGSYMDPKMSDV